MSPIRKRSKPSYATTHGPGYVEIHSIIQEAEELSIPRAAIAWSLKDLAYFGLVQFDNQSNTGYDSATYIRITNMGRYYLKELANQFVYLDLVWIDTPIAEPSIVKELLKRLIELDPHKESWHVEQRITRTEIFVDYLSRSEKREFSENPEYRDSALTKTEFMPNIKHQFEEEKKYIRSRRY